MFVRVKKSENNQYLQIVENKKVATVALKYKQLWMVEHAFKDMKSDFETRPIFHQREETIRGHVFCSFLALVLQKLYLRLENAGCGNFEWSDIRQDLTALQEMIIEESGKKLGKVIPLFKDGVRDLVRGLCCALHNLRVCLTSWQKIAQAR
jgi:transposase